MTADAEKPKPPFAVGDVVRLKIGGPAMIVNRVGPSMGCDMPTVPTHFVEAIWFEKRYPAANASPPVTVSLYAEWHGRFSGVFNVATLEPVDMGITIKGTLA